jgi:hypothetical protein
MAKTSSPREQVDRFQQGSLATAVAPSNNIHTGTWIQDGLFDNTQVLQGKLSQHRATVPPDTKKGLSSPLFQQLKQSIKGAWA